MAGKKKKYPIYGGIGETTPNAIDGRKKKKKTTSKDVPGKGAARNAAKKIEERKAALRRI